MKTSRRFVRMFKSRFAALVRDGAKRQTIRPMPKRMPRPGDIIDCREWAGVPYKSKQVKISERFITRVDGIEIWEDRIYWNGSLLFPEEMQATAKADGFETFSEMVEFFVKEHGLPLNGRSFIGILIKWKL